MRWYVEVAHVNKKAEMSEEIGTEDRLLDIGSDEDQRQWTEVEMFPLGAYGHVLDSNESEWLRSAGIGGI